MKIALIEKELHWENISNNLSAFEEVMQMLDSDCKMVVLPEMFSTGFTMNPEKFSSEDLYSVPDWMKKMASQLNAGVCGSTIFRERNAFFNRFYLALPDGSLSWYDKRHLFRMSKEQKAYQSGNHRKVFEFEGWRILPQICYDLRFPVWNRNQEDYDLAIYVANWPAAREDVWSTLLKARAIENQCYVVGVNRTGADPNVAYSGGSVVFSPKGEEISQVAGDKKSIITADVQMEALNAFREKFPVWKDRDSFTLNL